ncbi:hypothetical protein CRG98_032903 [Punica granatum]|uniref:G-patch domain-containing protein n=1 Tax=Punica granatum TaxID=22663 RepID=A0A2I0IRT5_PUNGR|nr:hypothetical protein CRG98_032903 [Punica granatum]
MGVTRSGRVYENPDTTSKGKAPAAMLETAPQVALIPTKKVTDEEAEAFMKIIKHDYVPGAGLGANGQGITHPIEIEDNKNRRGLGYRPSCHEIVQARNGKHLHHLAAHYGRINRGIPIPPLSYFFPGSPCIVGGTLQDSYLDSDGASVDELAIYAVSEETPPGVHIRPAQENEHLDNWTSKSSLEAPSFKQYGWDRECTPCQCRRPQEVLSLTVCNFCSPSTTPTLPWQAFCLSNVQREKECFPARTKTSSRHPRQKLGNERHGLKSRKGEPWQKESKSKSSLD